MATVGIKGLSSTPHSAKGALCDDIVCVSKLNLHLAQGATVVAMLLVIMQQSQLPIVRVWSLSSWSVGGNILHGDCGTQTAGVWEHTETSDCISFTD